MILPIGYLTLSEAAELLLSFKFAGQPDRIKVTQARTQGFNVSDGKAMNEIIEEIWSAVDRGTVTSYAIGGNPRRIIRLPRDFTKAIPTLRSARGRGFTYVRHRNPTFAPLVAWFRDSLSTVDLAFKELEIQKLGNILKIRLRHRKLRGMKMVGRPSSLPALQMIIRDIVNSGKWDSSKPLKALTLQVNRSGSLPIYLSKDTVKRGLDYVFATTGDRRFARQQRKVRRS